MAILNQKAAINVVPGVAPQTVVHLSQGNVGDTVTLYVYENSDPFDTSGLTASVQGVRKDGTGFGPVACTKSGNAVTFTVTSAMTAISGPVLAEITFTNGSSQSVSTANFAMLIEQGTFPNGPTYDTDISVYQQILQYVQSYPAMDQQIVDAAVAAEAADRAAADTSLGNQITALGAATAKKRRYILIGDSYGVGVVGPGGGVVNGWTYYFKQILGLSSTDCVISCANGAGFIGLQSTTFLDLLNAANASDPETVTDIIIGGGRNDLEATSQELSSAMNAFYARAKELYPNAQLSLCFCGCYWNRENNNHDKLLNTKYRYYRDLRFKPLEQASTYMTFMSKDYAGTDTTHFSQDGYVQLGRWIADAATGGHPVLTYPYQSWAITPETGITVPNLIGRVLDGNFIWLPGASFAVLFDSGVNVQPGSVVTLGTLPAPFYGTFVSYACTVTAMANIKERNGGFKSGIVTYMFHQGKLELMIWNGNPNGSGFDTFTDVSSVALQPGSYQLNGEMLFG